MDNIRGKTIVITGAARGIGAAIAQLLATADANLTLVGRNKEALHAMASDLPGHGRKFVQSVDIADLQQVKRGFSEAIQAMAGNLTVAARCAAGKI